MNTNIVRIFSLGLVLGCGLMCEAATGDEEVGVYKAGEDSYALNKVYEGPIYIDDDETELGNVSSLFFHDGYFYAYTSSLEFYAFPMPAAGSAVIARPVEIEEYDEGEGHPYRFYYFGETPEGQVYAASYIHAKPGAENKPFEIFEISFEEGWDKATVVRGWELPVGNDTDWGPRNPKVIGDLSTGNFTVAAQVWERASYPSSLSESEFVTKIATWEVTDNEVSAPQWARAGISPSMVSPLGDNRVLIHDKQYWKTATPNFTLSHAPMVAEIQSNNKLRVTSTLGSQCTQHDQYGCGASVFTLGNARMIFYNTGLGTELPDEESNKLGLAYLPDGVGDLSTARELTTLMPMENVTTSSIQGQLANISPVNASKIDDNKMVLSAMPYHESKVGIYTLDRIEHLTGVETVAVDTTTQAEYYTPEGLHISCPTAPGIYIRRTGPTAEKILLR